jgi:murein L,D-transpeptidase YcbB/YkuD
VLTASSTPALLVWCVPNGWREPHAPFDESGVFGPKTDSAVREFQNFNSLQVDGIVGKNTWKALLEQWMALDLSD